MRQKFVLRFRDGLLIALVASLGAFTSAAGVKRPTPDRSDAFFTNGVIPHFKIEITGTNYDNLQRDHGAPFAPGSPTGKRFTRMSPSISKAPRGVFGLWKTSQR